jgi:hypothetical protein
MFRSKIFIWKSLKGLRYQLYADMARSLIIANVETLQLGMKYSLTSFGSAPFEKGNATA